MILRTEAEDIGDGEPLICFTLEEFQGQTGWPKRKRGDYRRAAVAGEPLLFCALRFSSAFLAFTRCLCQATRFVLFIEYVLPF
jgi:hypothetical protein